MFQKRHYIKIAHLIRGQYEAHPTASRRRWAKQLCERTCIMFMNDNPNFDPDRFRDECGLKEEKRHETT